MHSCTICNYMTSSYHNLKKHLKTIKHQNLEKHLNMKKQLKQNDINFKCIYCDRIYSSKSNLNRHLNTCKNNVNNMTDNDKIQLEIEKLKCQYVELELEIRKNIAQNNNKKNKPYNNMSQYQKGLTYETYVLDNIKNNYKNCYRWNEIPINILSSKFYTNDKICDDIGCDIIGINHDNTIDYIQCKNYSKTIRISDLSGFYNFVSENSISNAIVYYTGKLSKQVILRKYNVQYINLKKNDDN